MNWKYVRSVLSLTDIAKQLGAAMLAISLYSALVWFALKRYEIRAMDWGVEAGLANSIIVGLLLGFRNRNAYDRWWEGRRLWGQLTNDLRNLSCKLAAFLPTEAVARERSAVLIPAFAEALRRHLRQETFSLRDLPGLEGESDDPTHKPLYLAGRLYRSAAAWKREGLLDEGELMIVDAHLRSLMDVCGGCERILNTGISVSYKALLRTGIAVNIAVAPWFALSQMGLMGVPTILLACFFLLGVELVDTNIEEPFGSDREDLDLERYCKTIRDSTAALLPVGRG